MTSTEDRMRLWRLADIRPLAQTPTSRLWRARSPDHGEVVLKVLTPYGSEERHGFRLMAASAGRGMARVFECDDETCLMEYLPGRSLGELVRQDRDEEATRRLAQVAAEIRGVPVPKGLIPLESYLAALVRTDLCLLPVAARPHLAEARTVAAALFADAPQPVALHGDLHHDNILYAPDGWRAIDAKGLVGDAAFEPANSFRNPWDRQDLARDPARALRLAEIYAEGLALDRGRLLDWAFVQVAVSLMWFAEDQGKLEDDLALLPVMAAARQIARALAVR